MNETERRAAIIDRLTSGDGEFALRRARIGRVEQPVYVHAPTNLREVMAGGGHWGDRLALTYEDEHRTWAQHQDTVDRFTTLLVDRYGIGKGDRVAVAMRNHPEWIAAFAAAVSVGAVCVPLNAWWTGPELVDALADCGARVLVADRERTEAVQARRGELPALRAVVEVRPGEVVRGDDEWAAVLAGEHRRFDPATVPIDPDDDATILYTSGTSGRPKGAVATHRAHLTTLMNMRVHAVVESELAQARGDEVPPPPERPTMLVTGPLFHVAYLPRVVSAAVTGLHLVLMYRWDARRAVELIAREEVDSLTAVPPVARQLMDEIERTGTRLPSLRTLATGGAQSTAALVGRIGSLFDGRTGTGTGYGLTETTGAMMMIGSRDYFARPLSVGRAFPTSQVRVVGADGVDVGTDEVGEAWFRGPNVARGYWNQETAAFTADGWFRTGDLVRRDADGFVHIVDRIKDVVIRGGENVYCAEVEERLADHPAVEDVSVVGVPHHRLGEEVAAVVQLRPGAVVTAEDLRAHAGLRLAPFKIPTRFLIGPDPLPRNAAGKVLKRELRGLVDHAGPLSRSEPS
ncbi:class I adenylate-forming enzyme family protein [Pseudonocardia sp. N23]|uniref:class I adenylate-forming enzyme family protein n=1 Tax=Pseudonocardia sp. N23 TaxID=1987376 RepID=UPI000BFC0ADF|nr:class I adenylate-forming enzyme family protein [Pseudonocardia sp. N23]GAY07645.1 long-chain-fatty-acid--CoA ligase [Pseudonocardia sp. N23]